MLLVLIYDSKRTYVKRFHINVGQFLDMLRFENRGKLDSKAMELFRESDLAIYALAPSTPME